MVFRDRREAGRLLGQLMAKRTWNNPIVLALPRGGIPVALEVSEAITAELDVIVTRKIGAPFNPEFALGAVDGSGVAVIDSRALRVFGVTEDYIRSEVQAGVAEVRRRMAVYRGARPLPSLAGRDVIIVDDGIATGHTLLSAVRSLAGHEASLVVAAAPVCPSDVAQRIERDVDLLIAVEFPEEFHAVGQFYADFPQLSDDEVRVVLARAWDDRQEPAT